MKLNHKILARDLTAAVVLMAAVATMSVGAFAAEDDAVVAGCRPPVENTVQGNIALYSGESTAVNTDEQTVYEDVTVVDYLPPMPMDQMIQGDIMLLSADSETPVAETAETTKEVPLAAGLTMTGPFWKQVLFTARQDGQVLTLAAPEDTVTVRGTIGDLRAQMAKGIGTLSVVTNKNSTTLNLTLMCDGYSDNTSFTLRQIGSRTILTIGGRCRRDLIIGR